MVILLNLISWIVSNYLKFNLSPSLLLSKQTFNFDFVSGIYNQFHNVLRLFDVLPNFPFTTSGTMSVITYKHGIYMLDHELPNELELRLMIIGNYETSGKCLNFIE